MAVSTGEGRTWTGVKHVQSLTSTWTRIILTGLLLWVALSTAALAQGTVEALKTEIPVLVDGNLSDLVWQVADSLAIDDTSPASWLPKGTFTAAGPPPKGPEDAALRLWTAWNDEFVYFAIDVIDDQLVADRIVGALELQDSVEIVIDPSREGHQRRALVFAPQTAAETGPWFSVPGSQVAVAKRIGGTVGRIRPLGYTAEIAIPMRAFVKAFGTEMVPGQSLGLEVRLNDVDLAGSPSADLAEAPERIVRQMTWTGTPAVLDWQVTPNFGQLRIGGNRR